MLGTDAKVSGMRVNNGDVALERLWPCGCVAQHFGHKDKIALWTPCPRHIDIFFVRHMSRFNQARSPQNDMRDKVGRLRRSFAPLLALGLMLGSVDMMIILLGRIRRAEAEAIVDGLTGLYNRRGWERRAIEERTRLQRQPETIAIFMMDVDDLKGINDREGHAAGDATLVRVAEVILSVTRQHDVAARFGGDEFGLLAMLSDERDAETIEYRLMEGFRAKGLSVSIGHAQVTAERTIVDAMESADREMYMQKEQRHSKRSRSTGFLEPSVVP